MVVGVGSEEELVQDPKLKKPQPTRFRANEDKCNPKTFNPPVTPTQGFPTEQCSVVYPFGPYLTSLEYS